MSRKIFKSVTGLFLIFSLASLHFPHMVRAELINVQSLMSAQQRAEKIDQARTFLQRQDVKEQMVSFGINPEEAQLRVEALSDQELNTLAQNIENLPSGAGVGTLLALVGLVFVVLITLELLGETNFFSSF
ncbi:MAG: PA2779 family protein [Deltaproteobacteria bacterium]|nr:PA2779 family protein [Deltaproteobacteria bacterium]